MSWICPWCGYENRIDPLNSRHQLLCGGCREPFITGEELLKWKETAIRNLKKELKENNDSQIETRSMISSLENDLASFRIVLESDRKEYSAMQKDLEKWVKTKIYGIDETVDRAAKARLDRMQQTLPFESRGAVV